MKMFNDKVPSTYMEPMVQQRPQGFNRSKTSWNQRLSSLTQPTTQVALTNSSSHLQAFNNPLHMNSSPLSTFRKNDIFDVNDSDKQDIRLAFTLFDSRRVGRLTYRELKAAIRALECSAKKEEVQKLMHQFSKEDNDEIGYEEFMQIMLRKYKEKNPEVDVGRIFAVYDVEGRGKISIKNLRKVAKSLGRALTNEQLESMINSFDKDEDGEVNQMEFFEIMKRMHV